MIEKVHATRFLLVLLMGGLALIAAQCGAVPTEESVPKDAAPQEVAQPAEETAVEEAAEAEAEPAEEVAEEEAAEAEPAEEASEEEAAEAEPAEDDGAVEAAAQVAESEAVKAKVIEGGITVVTDEPDVSAPRTERRGTYRDVGTSDGVSFHPYTVVDGVSFGYQGFVYDGSLLGLDEDTLEYEPNMAESYSISEDGLTFTFNLRQDMKWSDGEPLTAQDYKWTYDQVIKPENVFAYLSQLEFITSYEALDDYTLEIKIDEIYAPALGQMSGLITPLPKHIWENLSWDDPEKNPEINHPSVTSGPYKVAEWKRDQFIVFEANEDYWYHGPPNFEQYTIEIVPDQDIAFEKMKAGESDTAPIQPEKLEEAKQLDNVNVYEWWAPAASWSYIAYNMRDDHPTADIRVRYAINYAVDKELLTEEVMLGQARRICSPYADTSWVYNPDVPCYDYDPDKAVELLAEAGYTLQDDKMVDENGEQLKLVFVYGPNTSQVRELIAVTTQDFLSDIGIEVEVRALEWSSYLEEKRSEDSDWDLTTGTWGGVIEPHIMSTLFAEENIPDLNFMGYINEDLEEIFRQGGATYDTEVRKEKYQEAQQILAEDAPYMFLFYSKSRSGQNERIQGIDPKPVGIGWNQEDWFIEESPE
jgi:peptide/nickel transport system substrate-binding protein